MPNRSTQTDEESHTSLGMCHRRTGKVLGGMTGSFALLRSLGVESAGVSSGIAVGVDV
jgi:hypothetical protein